VNAVSKGYLITGTPEELEKSIPEEFRDYTNAIVDGAKQLADIQAEIEKAKKPKAKATTKAKAKPKAKTNAEKVADQRKKQIEESQKKAKETLQGSLDLGADRLDDKEDAEDIMKKAQEVDI
jgi:MoxR-like ATPase